MATFLLPASPSPEVEAICGRLHELIPELRDIKGIDEIATEINRQAAETQIVIFVSPDISAAGLDNLINISERYRERVFFILVSNEISATDYKRLMRSGGADWLAAQGSLAELQEIISSRLSPPPGSVEQKHNGKPTIVSFMPCRGGVGNTTVALEIALNIKLAKKTRSWRVCYIDLDFQTSHVCDYLDIEPRLRIQEIFDRPDRLDNKLFEAFVSKHSSGLEVLASPRSTLDPCATNVVALDALMDLILNNYDFVVIDLPPLWFAWTAPTIENSDAVVVTGINTVPCLHQLRATLDAVLAVKTSHVIVAINRIARGLFGGIKRNSHIRTVLPDKNIFYIQEDSRAIDRVNTGTPAMLDSNSSLKNDITKLSAYCVKLKLAGAEKKDGPGHGHMRRLG